MSWIVLVLSGLMEAVWATALDRISGLSRPMPIVVFVVAMCLSMAGLAYGMREIPVGTAYAVWVGIGASATVAWAMLSGTESASLTKILLVAGIIVCVIGLKLVSGGEGH
ncbi:SMR family transporter [Luteococcus sp. H138]|uniref:DMT family transporter n=1 Tax=unclassified Luteococcus TaxID=2639923 RepID=UPI00313F2EBA